MDVAVDSELGAGGGFTLSRDRVLEVGRMITTCKVSSEIEWPRASHLGAGNLSAQLVPGKLKGDN